MKFKISILIFIFFTIAIFKLSADELPSDAYLRTQQEVVNGIGKSGETTVGGPVSTPQMSTYSGGAWGDVLPGGSGTMPGGNTGSAPIGEATPAIVIAIFAIYMAYRGVTVSKRRNNL